MDEKKPNFSRLIKLFDEFQLVFEGFILNLLSNFGENQTNFLGYFREKVPKDVPSGRFAPEFSHFSVFNPFLEKRNSIALSSKSVTV